MNKLIQNINQFLPDGYFCKKENYSIIIANESDKIIMRFTIELIEDVGANATKFILSKFEEWYENNSN